MENKPTTIIQEQGAITQNKVKVTTPSGFEIELVTEFESIAQLINKAQRFIDRNNSQTKQPPKYT